jgi:hypothetical protein
VTISVTSALCRGVSAREAGGLARPHLLLAGAVAGGDAHEVRQHVQRRRQVGAHDAAERDQDGDDVAARGRPGAGRL